MRRAGLAVAGLLPVAALLAWVCGLGRFSWWFLATGVPAVVVLAALGSVTRRDHTSWVRVALVAGVLGGLLGTAGYDLFRIPFVLDGRRLFAPIESYGVLLTDARSSSNLTDLAGWSYHVVNGVGFGIAYAAVMVGRRWWWGIGWGLALETATLVTPFADAYALRGNWDVIAIAYAAHVPYGAAVGWAAQDAGRWVPDLAGRRIPVVATSLVAVAAGLLWWHQPWTDKEPISTWRRVPLGACATVDGQRSCPTGDGVHRVRGDGPYTGGFVLVDPALGRD